MLNNPAPLPLKIEPDDRNTEPLNVEPLATDVTTNPNSSLTDAVTLPLNIFVASTAVNASCASCVNAVNGISNKLAPLPEYVEPELIEIPPLTNKLPVNSEPLSEDSTLNPNCGDTEAVTLPLAIKVDNKASGDNAALGISNNPAPLPLNCEPDDKNIEPLNVEPLATDVTTNPLLSLTDAVTLPLAIFVESIALIASCASCVNAVNGISNNLAPLPE